jgi:hypothetical protein
MRTLKLKFGFIAVLAANLYCLSFNSNGSTSIDGVPYYNPPVIWGGETNFLRGAMATGQPLVTSIRAGIQVVGGEIVLSGQPLKLDHPAYIGLENLDTNAYPKPDDLINSSGASANDVIWMDLPPAKERLQLNMTDSSGATVPKTPEGLSLAQPFSLKPKAGWTQFQPEGTVRRGMVALMPVPGLNSCGVDDWPKSTLPNREELKRGNELDPSRYFILTNTGLYKLTATLSIYVEDTNTCLKPVTLPPVTVDVRVEK